MVNKRYRIKLKNSIVSNYGESKTRKKGNDNLSTLDVWIQTPEVVFNSFFFSPRKDSDLMRDYKI